MPACGLGVGGGACGDEEGFLVGGVDCCFALAPHSEQNSSEGVSAAPHEEHTLPDVEDLGGTFGTFVPHSEQNTSPSDKLAPQDVHFRIAISIEVRRNSALHEDALSP